MAGAGANSHILTLSQHTIDAYHVEMAKTVDPLLPAKRIHPTSVHSPKNPTSPTFFHHPLHFQISRIPSPFFPLSHQISVHNSLTHPLPRSCFKQIGNDLFMF